MSTDKQTRYEALRLDTKILAVTRIKEALEKDVFNDEAKLAKDTLSVFTKEDQTNGARDAVRFQMVSAYSDTDGIKEYVKNAHPDVARLAAGAKSAKQLPAGKP